MKIIAGKYKNRTIPTLRHAKYRPTTAKLKEALFNIITSGKFSDISIENSSVLDLFAGSGGLAFEAISRGANSVTLVDIDNQFLQIAGLFAKEIGVEKKVKLLHMNVLGLPQAYQSFDIVFIDPPYNQDLIEKSIAILIAKKWVHRGTLLVVELPRTITISYPNNSVELLNRIYGKSKLIILKVT